MCYLTLLILQCILSLNPLSTFKSGQVCICASTTWRGRSQTFKQFIRQLSITCYLQMFQSFILFFFKLSQNFFYLEKFIQAAFSNFNHFALNNYFNSLAITFRHINGTLSFFGLLKHDFQNRARVFKTLHTNSTTTHPNSKTLQILCIIKHSCKNYTLLFKNHTLLPYETHTFHITILCLHELHSAVINLKHFQHFYFPMIRVGYHQQSTNIM